MVDTCHYPSVKASPTQDVNSDVNHSLWVIAMSLRGFTTATQVPLWWAMLMRVGGVGLEVCGSCMWELCAFCSVFCEPETALKNSLLINPPLPTESAWLQNRRFIHHCPCHRRSACDSCCTHIQLSHVGSLGLLSVGHFAQAWGCPPLTHRIWYPCPLSLPCDLVGLEPRDPSDLSDNFSEPPFLLCIHRGIPEIRM